jgi:hypothetical protein
VLYVCGEESLEQVRSRAARIGASTGISLLPEVDAATIEATVRAERPRVVIIDSIQTLFEPDLDGIPGSVGQVRATAARLVRVAKSLDITMIVVGHVTKDGTLAGPRVLEHVVDTVLYFEGDNDHAFRIVRAAKTHLFGKTRGGFRLNTDFGRPCLELGRAFGFSYGDKENGAFFNHMNVMFAHALYRRGFIAEARKVFNSIFGMATSERAGIGPMIPEYFNAQGKGLYLYLTGSASWYVYTLAQEMLGIKFVFGELCLDPKLMSSQLSRRSLAATISLGAKRLRLIYEVKTRVPADRPLRIKKVVFRNKEISCSDRQCRVKVSSLTAAQNTIRIILQ